MSSRQNFPKPIRRIILSFQALFRVLIQGAKQATVWYLRRPRQHSRRRGLLSQAGFVLPTTIMVLLIVGLFTGALIVRTGERSEDVIRSREAQRIENLATPAVDRAKAKLEHIFNRDPRFPVGVPSEDTLRDMMRYIDNQNVNLIPDEPDPYTLPDEDRIDLDGDGVQDNAWSYETDLDGDGTSEVVAYSILMNAGQDNDCDGTLQRIDDNDNDDFPFYEDVNGNGTLDPGEDIDGNGELNIVYNTQQGEQACTNLGRNINEEDYGYWSSEELKANSLVTRTGPLSIQATQGSSSDCDISGLQNENGWFAANATSVRKNFQVNVFVQNQNDANKAVTALEFQQDRQLDRGNKFGVWFRYDLLIHPGPAFRLNGAIHTDGNLVTWNDSLRFYLVSSPDSCIYTEDANTITLTQEEDSDGTILYQAQAISATGSDEEVDLFGENAPSAVNVPFRHENDSVDAGSLNNGGGSNSFYPYTLDPLILYTQDRLVSRGMQNADGSYNVATARDTTWGNRAGDDPSDRIRNDIQRKPYVDDLYRADDRWGPKPKYGPDAKYTIDRLVDSGGNPIGYEENGDLIEASDADDLNPATLIGLNPPDEFPQEVGLDGYWERRAYVQGLRVIVGQRLELGSPFREASDIGIEEEPLRINFQDSDAATATPDGFIADTGEAYSTQNGYTYGWLDSTGTNPEQNDEGRDRNQGSTPQERDTMNHMDLGGPHWWQIDLPNDTYELKIVMGDASNSDSVNNITLEPGTANEVVITDPSAAANNFDVYPDDIALTTLEVTIDDGNLKIRPDDYAKIAYIEFLNYEVPVVAPSLSFDPLAALLPPDSAELPSDQEDSNLRRQQKTLRDNLAAVQATAIYHHNDDNDGDDGGVGDFPVATLATTAHPGTLTTIANSTRFVNNPETGDLQTNFLQGVGTNGWEFNAPGNVTTESDFENLIDDSTDTLREALTNLAYMSGDPFGAFPPNQDTADGDDTNDAVPSVGPVVHPYPQLTMWGDYSNLRRVIQQLDDGTAYDDLSLADRTTLQTSAATLGMLAYNIDYIEEIRDSLLGSGSLVSLGEHLQKLVDDTASSGNPEIGRDTSGNVVLCFSSNDGANDAEGYFDNGNPDERDLTIGNCAPSITDNNAYEASYYYSFSSEEWRQALELWGGLRSGSNVPSQEDIDNLEFITTYNQILADRTFGFSANRVLEADTSGGNYTGNFNVSTGNFTTSVNHGGVPSGTQYTGLSCDPNIFELNPEQPEVGLALAACNQDAIGVPKYPTLYYLFPVNDHNHDGTSNGNPRDRQPDRDYNNDGDIDDVIDEQDFNGDGEVDAVEDFNSNGQLDTGLAEATDGPSRDEPYITDHYIFERSVDDPTTGTGVNWGLTYKAVEPSDIALNPRDRGNWVLPHTTSQPTAASGANLTDSAINEITEVDTNGTHDEDDDTETSIYIPFLDKGMYNGRQLMMARVLNIDLGILRDNFSGGITNDNINDESWLPNSGQVYAFREDALREDGIARPRVNNWADCNTEAELTGQTDCQMNPNVPRDPPKRDVNAVSPKPVDFVADPARRPNGFRLSNGSELGRVGTTRGLSFITDNPAYTLGDFNLHSREEFTESLNRGNWNNFYSRDTLDTGFARGDATNPNNAGFDTWRPTEVLADAITVLSNVYCDGTIEAGIRENNNSNVSGCSGSTESFHNTNIDGTNNNAWLLEDGSTAPSGTDDPSPVPIYVDRNGDLFFDDGGTPTRYTGYQGTTSNRPLNGVGNNGETTINLVFISGLSPTRVNETYGGLHNFPRFNEDWSTNLNISGSIIQLNFSSYDSANLDQQDTFAPTDSPNGGAGFPFYTPPNRRWGYDPALQYNPPGPIVERLLSQSGLRSELYQENEVSDPYVQQLCRAVTNNSDTCPDP